MELAQWHGGPARYAWEKRIKHGNRQMKLSPEIVRQVRGMTPKEVHKLAKRLKCSATVLFKARRRDGWRWVED